MRKLSGLFLVILIAAACNPFKKEGPYQLAKVKTEKQETNDSSSYNEMFLYIVGDRPDADSLQSFCTARKKDFKNAGLYMMVFFDKEEHAGFPKSLTEGFTADSSREHIKAIYRYNTANGESRLDYYEENALRSPVKSFDIR